MNTYMQASKYKKAINYCIYLLTVLSIVFIAACNNKEVNNKEFININVKLSTNIKSYLYLLRIEPKSSVVMDSILVNSESVHFRIKAYQSPDIYLIRISNNQSLMLSAKTGDNIDIEINTNTIPLQYNIKNSFDSELIKKNNMLVNSAVKNFDSVYAVYRESKNVENLNVVRAKTDSSLKAIQEHLYYNLRKNIETHPSSLSSIIGLYSRFANSYIFNLELDSSLFYLISDSCINEYPNNSHTIALNNSVVESKEILHNRQIKERLLDKGNIFKDICMLCLDESKYCIYNNAAKYKIIYIWRSQDKAFWDDNPKLKKLYNSYNRQTLDIIGISAEKDKLSWLNYCTMEGLNWINLIAEPSQIEDINPTGIFPRIYLLNKDFIILAKDPDLKEIENVINQ